MHWVWLLTLTDTFSSQCQLAGSLYLKTAGSKMLLMVIQLLCLYVILYRARTKRLMLLGVFFFWYSVYLFFSVRGGPSFWPNSHCCLFKSFDIINYWRIPNFYLYGLCTNIRSKNKQRYWPTLQFKSLSVRCIFLFYIDQGYRNNVKYFY